jgi:hypothetical protein
MKRLAGLIVLLGLLAAGLYYWRSRPEPPVRLDGFRLPPAAAVRDRLGDAALRVAVESAFALNRRLQPADLAVEAEGGVVTLRGEVESAELKALARRVAADVPGVASVTDRVRVKGHASPRP